MATYRRKGSRIPAIRPATMPLQQALDIAKHTLDEGCLPEPTHRQEASRVLGRLFWQIICALEDGKDEITIKIERPKPE